MKMNKIISHYDLDGVVSAALLSYKTGITNIKFVPSTDRQKIDKKTIIADLEYSSRCGMWFDHHISNKTDKKVKGSFVLEKSCARVIFNYYKGDFSDYFKKLVEQLDKADSGEFTKQDVQQQSPLYILNMVALYYRFKNKKLKNKFLNKLLEQILQEKQIEEIITEDLTKKIINDFKKEIKKSSDYIKDKKKIINDKILYIEHPKNMIINTFGLYLQYPKITYFIMVRTIDKKIGILIIKNKFENVPSKNIGEIMKKYGGGGHPEIGGCRIPKKDKNKIIPEIIKALT